ncbi:MAG: tripartite tricarboxylate transporter permease [Gemmatimonadales bacterium]|nr:MAG: tripartite tricarboxylate transporter permease [Gemmatimonadales bacterium]
MSSFSLLLEGFAVALRPLNLAFALGGVGVGTVVGMLPGIGPINAIAILLPVIFAVGLPAESALILLAGIYYGSQYGNSISTILLNVPGTTSSVVTAIDGYPLTQQGKAGPALATAAIASFVGGTLSIFGLVLLAPLLASWALRFGPAEYVALMALAFAALSSFSGGSFPKALVATGVGLLLASVGLDPNSSVARFTFGELRLLDGLDFVVVTIGLFAISEVFLLLERTGAGEAAATRVGRVGLTMKELAFSGWSMLRGSVIGFLMGVLPGAGGTVSTFVAYGAEQRISDREGTFGKGDLRGVAAPEAANNAAATGALIPLLTLGVPGSATTAVLLGALMGLNVTPGPLLLERNPEVFWGLVASMYIGNLFLLALNLPLVRVFVRVLSVPRWILVPGIAALGCVAVYAVNGSVFDLFLMVGFGVAGYGFRKVGIPLAPVILGLVLGPLMEKNLRRALALGGGDWSVLVSSPLAVGIWGVTLAVLALPLVGAMRARRQG